MSDSCTPQINMEIMPKTIDGVTVLEVEVDSRTKKSTVIGEGSEAQCCAMHEAMGTEDETVSYRV